MPDNNVTITVNDGKHRVSNEFAGSLLEHSEVKVTWIGAYKTNKTTVLVGQMTDSDGNKYMVTSTGSIAAIPDGTAATNGSSTTE